MRILLIQTAFLGDVILITPMIRTLKNCISHAKIDVLVRKGNESLLANNPHVNQVYIWDKKNKYKSLFENLRIIRSKKYDQVVCVQRYFNAGFLTTFSQAKFKVGFKQNPWSFLFNLRFEHRLLGTKHEVERNFELVSHLVSKPNNIQPEVFPSLADEHFVLQFKKTTYFCLAPASVWFTKQLPDKHWVTVSDSLPDEATLYFLGAPGDFDLAQKIINSCSHRSAINMCGKLSLMQSAVLMRDAQRNYVNDSGPLHLCSATNAKVTAFFCSTIPEFGFGPLSEQSQILETKNALDCRPCGTHGYKTCPKGHFACGNEIDLSQIKF